MPAVYCRPRSGLANEPPPAIRVEVLAAAVGTDEGADPGSGTAVLLDALEADHDYLLEGGVFTEDLISTWIAYKREVEIDALRLRPHPYEFALYYDI